MWACRMDHIEHFELLSQADNQDVLEDDGFERDNNGRTWMHWSVRRVESLECLKVGWSFDFILLFFKFVYLCW